MQAILDRISEIVTGGFDEAGNLCHIAGLAQAYASLSGSDDPR